MSAALAALILFLAFPVEVAAAPRSPTVSGAAGTLRIGGVEHVDARVFFARLGFKSSWVKRGEVMSFRSSKDKIELEAGKRDVDFNGMRVLIGEPTVFRGKTLYISRIDADQLFLPILRPAGVRSPAVPDLRVIVIDAGHGGQDTGTRNAGLKLDEKVFTLDVAKRLRARLVKHGYKVVMTRTDDRFISLQKRADIANKAGADLFISIHFNAVGGAPSVRGSETYTMTPRYQRSTGNAEREASDKVDNPGNHNDPWNALLGYHMHAQILGKLGSFDRGFKRARFAVLRLVNSPGVLIEAGYLTNDDEARKIGTPAYRDAIADALANGVQAYGAALKTAKK